MDRKEAISIICNLELERLSKEKRKELLYDWWGIDKEDSEFVRLPETLQNEILESDGPTADVTDLRYNPLLFEALKHKYFGVKNEYLSELISSIMLEKVQIEGEEENLFTCPCCLYQTIKERGQYEICPVCFWEDDGNNDVNRYSSVNHMTLEEGNLNFKKYGCVNEKLIDCISPETKNRYFTK